MIVNRMINISRYLPLTIDEAFLSDLPQSSRNSLTSAECPAGSSSLREKYRILRTRTRELLPGYAGIISGYRWHRSLGVSVFPRRKERRSQWLQVIFSACENIPTASLRLVTPSSPSPSRTVNSVLFVDDSPPFLPSSLSRSPCEGSRNGRCYSARLHPFRGRRRGPNKFAPRSARGSYNGRRLRAYIFFRVMLRDTAWVRAHVYASWKRGNIGRHNAHSRRDAIVSQTERPATGAIPGAHLYLKNRKRGTPRIHAVLIREPVILFSALSAQT